MFRHFVCVCFYLPPVPGYYDLLDRGKVDRHDEGSIRWTLFSVYERLEDKVIDTSPVFLLWMENRDKYFGLFSFISRIVSHILCLNTSHSQSIIVE